MKNLASPGFSKSFKAVLVVYVLSILSVYAALQDRYRPSDSDDSWSLSFAYNYLHRGITYDLTFGYPRGGVQYFWKTYSFVVGKTLDVAGWSRTHSHLISLFFIVLALVLWSHLLSKLNYSKELSWGFAFSALLFDPFFTAATSSRPDAFVFLLVTVSLVFFIKGKYFWAAVAACLSVENHPLGSIVLPYVAALFLSFPSIFSAFRRQWLGNTLLVASGLTIGVFGFLSLHPDFLKGMSQIFSRAEFGATSQVQNLFYEYFFRTKYLRHIPELAVILVLMTFYVSRRIYKLDPFVGWLLASLVLYSFAIWHVNFRYAFYCYPAILLLFLRVPEVLWNIRYALMGFWLLLVPQYLFVYHLNRDFSSGKEITLVEKAVPQDDLPVLGGFNEWFAFYQRDFYINTYSGDFSKLALKKFYLIEDEHYRETSCASKTFIQGHYLEKPFQELKINDQLFVIKLETLKS